MGRASEDGWNTKPKIDEARFIAPDKPNAYRARKDRHRWCRGKVGQEHKRVYRLSKNTIYFSQRYPDNPSMQGGCGWRQRHHWNRSNGLWEPLDSWFYRCGHELGCSECGKVLTVSWRLPERECPDWIARELS